MIRKPVIDDYDKMYALWLSCKGMGLNDTEIFSCQSQLVEKAA